MSYAINLDSYYESRDIKTPLLQSSVVSYGSYEFTVDHWFRSDLHCYVLIDQKNNWKPFAKKPSEIKKLIDEGKLKIIKHDDLFKRIQEADKRTADEKKR
jgi:hypothetical protein